MAYKLWYTTGIDMATGLPSYLLPILQAEAAAKAAANAQKETVTPPQFRITWDTIGQTIYRSIGHARFPLRTIWCQGIIYPMETEAAISPLLTFAAALCRPMDPSEEGQVQILLMGDTAIYDVDQGGIIIPDGLSVEDANALQNSLNNAVVYPGDEAQEPAPLIVADRGADKTNAFRGLRYIVLPLYPLIEGFGNLTMQWQRTNTLGYAPAAVEFAAGSS